MQALTFRKAVIVDRSNFLESLIDLLEGNGIRYCVIGGAGVNAYVEPDLANRRDVLDLTLPVADLADFLQGKIWAAQEASRRGSKRVKDVADIQHVIESYPHLRDRIPADILARFA